MKTDWIKCSERLPDQGDNVIIFCKDGNERIATFSYGDWHFN